MRQLYDVDHGRTGAPASATMGLGSQERRVGILPVRTLILIFALLGFGLWQFWDSIGLSIGQPASVDDSSPSDVAVAQKFTLCKDGQMDGCVIDSGQLIYQGQVIRLADVDTPSIYGADCPAEAVIARRGADQLVKLLNGGPFAMRDDDVRPTDEQGHQLKVLMRDGVSLGSLLVRDGLARDWSGSPHKWCRRPG